MMLPLHFWWLPPLLIIQNTTCSQISVSANIYQALKVIVLRGVHILIYTHGEESVVRHSTEGNMDNILTN
jgi:hypothetical protein